MAKEVLKHIVNPVQSPHLYQEGMTSQDIVDLAMLQNRHVNTLCGLRHYPKGETPTKACDKCLEVAILLVKDQEGGEAIPDVS